MAEELTVLDKIKNRLIENVKWHMFKNHIKFEAAIKNEMRVDVVLDLYKKALNENWK